MTNFLITGGGSGIGLAVARLANRRGHRLCLFDRTFSKEVRAEFQGEPVALVEGDVVEPASCEEGIAAAVAQLGGLDGVSHNAGIQRYGTAADTSHDLWAEVINVNLTGAFNIAKAALPHIRRARGSFVFTGSVQSLATQQNVAAYTASKHGLVGLAKSIAVDFAQDGVRSNVVAPGAVDTPMLEWAISLADHPDEVRRTLNEMHPLGRVATAEEVASVVLFLLSEDAAFVTGETVRVDGGMLSRIAGTPREVEK